MSGENAEFLFVVRLRENGAPWVVLQPKHEGLATLKGEIGLDLYRGTSLGEAKQLVQPEASSRPISRERSSELASDKLY